MGTDLGSGGLNFERHGLDIVIRDRQSAFYGLSKRPWKPIELSLGEKRKAGKEKRLECVLGKPRVLEGWRETDMVEVERGRELDWKKDVVVS